MASLSDSGEAWHKPDAFLRLNPGYNTGISNYWDSRRITPSSALAAKVEEAIYRFEQ